MGADIIGWRDCPLQADLGADGFLGKLKLRAYKAQVERLVAPEKRATTKVVVNVLNRGKRELGYADIAAEVATFQAGIPECADCPVGGGVPLGCYKYVTYPIDAVAERLIFAFFIEKVQEKDSISDQLYRDIVSQFELDEEAGWVSGRGENGAFAELEEPLAFSWGRGRSKRSVTSAQVLAALTIPLDSLPLVAAYARFYTELLEFVDGRVAAAGVELGEDGAVEVHVRPKGKLDPEAIAEQAVGAFAAASDIAGSRTLGEMRQVQAMLVRMLRGAVDHGWTVVVDG